MQLPRGQKAQQSHEERPSLACVSPPWVRMGRKGALVARGPTLVTVQAVGMKQFKIQVASVLSLGYYIPSNTS